MLTSSLVLDSARIQQALVVEEVICGLGSGFNFLHSFMTFPHLLPAARLLPLECTPLAFLWDIRASSRSMGNVLNPLGDIWCMPSPGSRSSPHCSSRAAPSLTAGP